MLICINKHSYNTRVGSWHIHCCARINYAMDFLSLSCRIYVQVV